MGLTPEQIRELYKNKRTKGLYEAKLTELLNESDEPGVDPAETWPMEFGDKNATTMYQGFRNAAEKLEVADDIDVVQRDGSVFLLVKERVAVLMSADNGTIEDAEAVVSA